MWLTDRPRPTQGECIRICIQNPRSTDVANQLPSKIFQHKARLSAIDTSNELGTWRNSADTSRPGRKEARVASAAYLFEHSIPLRALRPRVAEPLQVLRRKGAVSNLVKLTELRGLSCHACTHCRPGMIGDGNWARNDNTALLAAFGSVWQPETVSAALGTAHRQALLFWQQQPGAALADGLQHLRGSVSISWSSTASNTH